MLRLESPSGSGGQKKPVTVFFGLKQPVSSLFESRVKRSTAVLLTLPMNDHKAGY